MKWISVSTVPSSDENCFAVYCINDVGELWCYIPRNDQWKKVSDPHDLEHVSTIAERAFPEWVAELREPQS